MSYRTWLSTAIAAAISFIGVKHHQWQSAVAESHEPPACVSAVAALEETGCTSKIMIALIAGGTVGAHGSAVERSVERLWWPSSLATCVPWSSQSCSHHAAISGLISTSTPAMMPQAPVTLCQEGVEAPIASCQEQAPLTKRQEKAPVTHGTPGFPVNALDNGYMQHARRGAASVSLQGKTYIAGGWNGAIHLSCMESTCDGITFTDVPLDCIPRSCATATVIGPDVFLLVGGWDGSCLDVVEQVRLSQVHLQYDVDSAIGGALATLLLCDDYSLLLNQDLADDHSLIPSEVAHIVSPSWGITLLRKLRLPSPLMRSMCSHHHLPLLLCWPA